MHKKYLRSEKGTALILVALSIFVLFGFGALAIDIGHLYNVKNQLQLAADAAALAGVTELRRDATIDLNPDCPARQSAFKVASMNFADVAYDTCPGCNDGPGNLTSPDVEAGMPIPVSLKHRQEDRQIEVGYWDGFEFFPAPNSYPINGVRVTVMRDGSAPFSPKVHNWFSKVFRVFKLIGADYDLSSMSAVAVAAKEPARILPIAVNEYWAEDQAYQDKVTGEWIYPTGDPYEQRYPESFMRSVNIDAYGPTPPSPPTMARGGQTFAIGGTRADILGGPMDVNSFVDVVHRNEYHAGITSAWWEAKQDTTTGTCSPTCGNNLTALPAGQNPGDVNNDKHDEVFKWLFTGIPDNVIPPNAVREVYRSPEHFGADNYNSANLNDPSRCPFASVASFSSGGNFPELPQGPNGMRFSERWPKGTRFIVMVYDGTHRTDVGPSQANVVTVVGYGIIEIDGYMNEHWDPFSGKKSELKTSGNTAYGHAVPHGLTGVDPSVADISDTFLVQPSNTNRTPECSDFIGLLRQMQENATSIHLVGPNLRYGLASH